MRGSIFAPLPPFLFLAGGVDVVMVDGAKRHGELVAHLEAQPSGLRVAYVVRVRRQAPADEARLTGDEAEMLLAADPFRFTDG